MFPLSSVETGGAHGLEQVTAHDSGSWIESVGALEFHRGGCERCNADVAAGAFHSSRDPLDDNRCQEFEKLWQRRRPRGLRELGQHRESDVVRQFARWRIEVATLRSEQVEQFLVREPAVVPARDIETERQ
jgi:hypothetical protein